MTEKQLSQKEKDLLVTHYLNKMSQYLRPFPISLGKFFKGEVSIDSALPFRNVLNLGVEVSDITQRIYPFSNKHLENLQSSGLNAAIYYFESIIPVIKIDGKPLQEIIDETGYQLKLVEDPVARVVSNGLFARLTVQRDWLGDVDKTKKEYVLILARAVAELIKLNPDHEFYNDQSDLGNGDDGYLFDIKFAEDGYHLLFTSTLHQIKIQSVAEDELLTKTR